MKKKFTTLLFVFTVINMFGQAPTASKPSKTNPSDTKVLTVNDIVTNKLVNPLKKVPLDEKSILI